MSDIYVKWNKLKERSENIKNYSVRTSQLSSRVRDINNSLRLSSDSADSVRKRLNYDADKIAELARELKDLSSVLATVSSVYNNAEKHNIER